MLARLSGCPSHPSSLRQPQAHPRLSVRSRPILVSVKAIAGMEPTINFDRVTDDIFVGSCLRNAADAEKAQQAGTAVIFSLQDETDLAQQAIDAAAVEADCQAQGVKYVRVPTSDIDEEILRQLLPAAVAAFAREIQAAGGKSAYIHCNGGRGRAPTIVVAYLYWLRGQGLAEAVATMTAGRKSSPKLPVIAAATADLLGGSQPVGAADQGALSESERAAIAAQLQKLM